jgi:hypothetical protein
VPYAYAIRWWPTLPLFTELPSRLVFSETQKASEGKKTAGALEEIPALFIHLLRKGVPKGRSLPPLLYLCAMGSRTRWRTREKKQ